MMACFLTGRYIFLYTFFLLLDTIIYFRIKHISSHLVLFRAFSIIKFLNADDISFLYRQFSLLATAFSPQFLLSIYMTVFSSRLLPFIDNDAHLIPDAQFHFFTIIALRKRDIFIL